MSEFDALAKACAYLPTNDIEFIRKAYLFAEKAHQSQSRLSGERYIIHPIAVASIVSSMRMDKESIIAALLHDVIEDTPYKKGDIKKQFGKEVAKLVDGLSKLTKIKFESHAETQAENFRKLILAMVQDIRVILIKLADRLHNIRTLEHHHPPKRRRIAKETLEIYAPIANRLGIHAFRIEFEEMSFTHYYPFRSKILKNELDKNRQKHRHIIEEIEKNVTDALISNKLEHFQLNKHPRTLYSIYKQMRDEHLRFSEVEDAYQFHVIVNNVDECYRTLGILHSLYKPLPDQFKDYIAIPKLNGYQSLHTVLFGPYGMPIRIQIRSKSMHKMAEFGIASYWLYRKDEKITDHAQKRVRDWMTNLLEMQKNAGTSLEFIEHVKNDLFPDEIYVFTPKGTILELPGNATPIDFAYAIHTDVGNNCVAAKINKRLVPLSMILQNGQTVEIITSKTATPNPAWLNFVASGKARSAIRSALKYQKKGKAAALGKRLVEKSLAEFGTRLRNIPRTHIKDVLSSLKLKSLKILFSEIGLGNQLAPIIAKRFINHDQMELAENLKKGEPLHIKGTEGILVNFAKCCYPIPGDPIEGILTMGQGLVVHHASCKNLLTARHEPNKCIDLSWADRIEGEFSVGLRIEIINQKGSLARLALAIADAETNIEDIYVLEERKGKCAVLSLIITIQNRIHLAQVIRNIRQLSVVTKVTRDQNI
ncbi:MAG: bifunctional (p)ppGpp synthetase/guanosine-3',5'-bis(diphosphate) 3'-pyrophosphohydrolase [Gammaproteobacteria bacterium]|nr:bifunctional (p)ppGpp synthetase/guanosine-3',5'-bis(diphosphate) 3'-pyrophosphohydrolase [Gammaproteobacteria bacterium]